MKNNYVLITGGLGRVGISLSNFLLSNDYKVIIFDLNKNIPPKFQKYVESERLIFKSFDCLNLNKFKSKLADLKKLNIAGYVNCLYPKSKYRKKNFLHLDKKSLDHYFSINLTDNILILQEVVNFLIKNNLSCSIINISSIQGISAPKFEHYKGTKMSSSLEYTLIKHSLNGLTKYLAKYLANSKVRFNNVVIGGIKNNQDKKFVSNYRKSCLSKGLLDAEDISGTIEFLISDSSKYINGQNIVIDDGWSL